MKLKIISDAKDPSKTRFIDAESGNELVGVVHAEVHIEPFDVKAILILDDFELEIETEDVLIDEGSSR